MRKTISAILMTAAAVSVYAVNVSDGPDVYDMADYGTTLSITNATADPVHFSTALIKYDGASTNTITFSKAYDGITYQFDTENSSSTTAASDVWENPYKIPFYPSEVLVIGTTDTNVVIQLIKAED